MGMGFVVHGEWMSRRYHAASEIEDGVEGLAPPILEAGPASQRNSMLLSRCSTTRRAGTWRLANASRLGLAECSRTFGRRWGRPRLQFVPHGVEPGCSWATMSGSRSVRGGRTAPCRASPARPRRYGCSLRSGTSCSTRWRVSAACCWTIWLVEQKDQDVCGDQRMVTQGRRRDLLILVPDGDQHLASPRVGHRRPPGDPCQRPQTFGPNKLE